MKIKSITVRNFKAVSEQELNLNGASVIVTAGNNKGKTSVLRGLIDRFRGEKPEIIVKEGEEKGISTMELTDGSKIGWSFTKKTENFSFTTAEDIKMTTGVISAIGEKYFGIKFKIEKFLQSSMKEQLKQVQVLLGIDLSEIEERYKAKFDERTEVNREVKRLRALNKVKPDPVGIVDVDSLKDEKNDLILKNNKLKEQWSKDNEIHQKADLEFNKTQDQRSSAIVFIAESLVNLERYKGSTIGSFIDFKGINDLVENIPEPKSEKEITTLAEPKYHSFSEIDKKIEEAYENKSKSDAYDVELKAFNDWVKEGKKAKEKADKLSGALDKINEEKIELLKKAKLPKEFEMTDEGLLYNGFPLDENQISSSGKYIAALKLGSLALGKLRTMHFDCSFLDKNSLDEIQKWADDNDYQLLIERPDWDGGDIAYEIIEEL